jgi:RimJ/RimL family protein N-acetyltransferase
MIKNNILKTNRLILRPSTTEDAAFFLELLNTPKWIEFIGDRNVHTTKEAEEYIKNKMLPQYEKLGFGNYTVIRKLDGEKIGSCGLYDREGIDGVDIGFAFLPAYNNEGYGFEASKELLHAAKNTFNLKKVNAITTKENVISQKLILKLGLIYEATIKIPNDEEELLLYNIDF